ncbi:MAG: PspC domain-containing protein [Coprobacter sp.]|nr:PspC domain-containing protein [Coprobacter sp.]
MSTKKLLRSSNKVLAGVCGGVAEYFDVDPTLVRAITVVGAIFTACLPFLIAYVVLIFIIPQA